MVLTEQSGWRRGNWNWPNKGCPKAPHLSQGYTRRDGFRFFCISFLSVELAALSFSFLHVAINLRPPSVTISHHLLGSIASVFHPSPSPIPNWRSSAKQFAYSFSLPLVHADPFLWGSHHDPLGQSADVYSDECPRPQQPPRAHDVLNVLTVCPLKGDII